MRWALRPNWYLVVTVVSWGFNFVALKEAYREINPPSLALLRYLVMWASLVLVCLWRKESLRYPREDALKLLYLGFVSMGIYMLLFLEGMHHSGATEGAIILQLSPIFTAILSALFGQERFSPGALGGGLVAFAGTGLILYGPSNGRDNQLVYNLVVVLSALLWAYSVTVMRPLLRKYSPVRTLTLAMPGGLPVMLIYGLGPALRLHWANVTPYAWTMFLQIAVVSGVVAFLCFYQGVKQVGGSGATLYQFLVPAFAMTFALLIQGAVPNWRQIAGFVIVLAGVGYASRARSMTQAAFPIEA